MKTKSVVTISEVIKDASDRINTPNPPFFDRINKWAKTASWIAGSVGTVGVVIITNIASGGITVPLWITIGVSILSGLGTLGVGVGVGAANIANMTTSNKELLERPSNKQ